MDPREASTEFRHRPRDAMNAAPPLAPFKREAEPWRGSSGFGLADILNRSSSSAGASTGPSIPPPKFSLPALHSFSKPLAPPSDRSILNDPSREDAAQFAPVSSRQQQQQQQQQQQSPVASPAKGGSRRIAPAPVDEEEGEAEEDLASSIRGGRWTADEHERFLEGFRVHGHKWKRVQQVVRTRSVTQVRTHAQKYLLKVAKLKAERKHKAEAGGGGGGGGGDRYDPASDQDASQTAPSSPARSTDSGRSPRRSTPRKKVRKLEHGSSDPVDQEYIAAAATTLCFLMTQKIADTRLDLEGKDLEPYDCYSTAAPAEPERFAVAADDSGFASANARKRSFMHFITESPPRFETERADYRAYDSAEPSAYAVEGNRLCS